MSGPTRSRLEKPQHAPHPYLRSNPVTHTHTHQVSAGVGLNTRVGTASFITSIAGRFPGDLRPFCPKLIQALTEAARIEGSKAVRKAYATALANVGKCAADKRLGRLVEDTVRTSL